MHSLAMTTPPALEREHTLLTAVARYDTLRAHDSLGDTPLGQQEALEMLARGEVIARKARYGRQLGVRSARAAGASWTQIGAALGTSKQSAWEAHQHWIDELADRWGHDADGVEGLTQEEARAARALAGDAD